MRLLSDLTYYGARFILFRTKPGTISWPMIRSPFLELFESLWFAFACNLSSFQGESCWCDPLKLVTFRTLANRSCKQTSWAWFCIPKRKDLASSFFWLLGFSYFIPRSFWSWHFVLANELRQKSDFRNENLVNFPTWRHSHWLNRLVHHRLKVHYSSQNHWRSGAGLPRISFHWRNLHFLIVRYLTREIIKRKIHSWSLSFQW